MIDLSKALSAPEFRRLSEVIKQSTSGSRLVESNEVASSPAVAAVLDEFQVVPGQRRALVFDMLKALDLNITEREARFFGSMSAGFSLGTEHGRPSREARHLEPVFSELDSTLSTRGLARGFRRLELRQRAYDHFSAVNNRGFEFDGTRQFALVGVGKNHEGVSLGTIEPRSLLNSLPNPLEWSPEQTASFRGALLAQLEGLLAKVPEVPRSEWVDERSSFAED